MIGDYVSNGDKEINKILENIDNISMLDDEEMKKMDFYELAYYVQTLNRIESLANDDDSDEVL